MKKNYQTSTRRAGTSGRTTPKKAKADPRRAATEAALKLPDSVSVAIADLAGELEEGLLAFVVGTGLKVVQTMMEQRPRRWPVRGVDTTRSGRQFATDPTPVS